MLGDLASPPSRGHRAKDVCELTNHETPLLRAALDTNLKFMKYTRSKIFEIHPGRDFPCLLHSWSFLLLKLPDYHETIILYQSHMLKFNNSKIKSGVTQLWQYTRSNQYPLARLHQSTTSWFQNKAPFTSFPFDTKRRKLYYLLSTYWEAPLSIMSILPLSHAKFPFCLWKSKAQSKWFAIN